MIATGHAPRVPVDLRLIDDISGCEVAHAYLIGSDVRLTFQHLNQPYQKVLDIPAAAPLNEVIQARQIEPVDLQGRSRLLQVSPEGLAALKGVVVRLDELERARRAARASRADVTLFGVGKSSSKRWGMIAAIDAAPTNAKLRYSAVVFLKSVRLTDQRLELTVEIGERTLTAALQDPTEEALEAFAWGASAGRLMWHGLLEGMQRPEAVRVVVEDLEAIHQELRLGRQTAENGVLNR